MLDNLGVVDYAHRRMIVRHDALALASWQLIPPQPHIFMTLMIGTALF